MQKSNNPDELIRLLAAKARKLGLQSKDRERTDALLQLHNDLLISLPSNEPIKRNIEKTNSSRSIFRPSPLEDSSKNDLKLIFLLSKLDDQCPLPVEFKATVAKEKTSLQPIIWKEAATKAIDRAGQLLGQNKRDEAQIFLILVSELIKEVKDKSVKEKLERDLASIKEINDKKRKQEIEEPQKEEQSDKKKRKTEDCGISDHGYDYEDDSDGGDGEEIYYENSDGETVFYKEPDDSDDDIDDVDD